MAVAMIYPETQKGKRTDLLNNSTSLGFDKGYLSQARSIYQYCREDKVDLVMSGDESLNDAYGEAMRRKKAKSDKSGSLATLRESSSDLADLVDEGRMELSEALAADNERKKNDRANRVAIYNVFKDIFKHYEFMTREHKPTYKRLEGFKDEFNEYVGMNVNEAIRKIDKIKKSDVIKSYLEII